MKSIEQISTLLDQGRDTYLTTKLAEHLQSFQKFVQDSIDLELDDGYHESDTALVLIHTPLNTQKLIIHNKRDSDHDKMWNIIQRAKKKKKEIDNIIYAPITSGLFDLRFIHDIQKLKTFIREVVQNTPHTPSISQNS